ncbi:pyridoxamine 5'-phosphate oxidase family protein [Streptomyces sp. NPDC047525]|uniref:pyridoxamine 5'-phosphate oxidase family protein n=1 Tax=Streptomyces sp. NPDC047525 TaxID=3155264 RepID=UPI00340B7B78
MSALDLDQLAHRTRKVLDQARYLNLATVSADGEPWVATLQYAWRGDPLRLVFGSATTSRHGHDIAARPRVSGSLFVAGGDHVGLAVEALDGAQFSGHCEELTGVGLERHHAFFYEALFPDERERARWLLAPSELRAPAPHRLYLVEVDRWWLVDTRTWEQDRIDRRVEVPLKEVELD